MEFKMTDPNPDPVEAVTGGDPNPRVGGGTDPNSWWTGGSNIPGSMRRKPMSTLARRPTDFRSAEKIETGCTAGLPEERRIDLADETTYTITLHQWIREIVKKVEDCGMDTIFRIYDPTKATQEKYIFDCW